MQSIVWFECIYDVCALMTDGTSVFSIGLFQICFEQCYHLLKNNIVA